MRWSRRSVQVALLSVLALAGACGTGPDQQPGSYGWICKTSADCGARGTLSCEPFGDFSTKQCTVALTMCTLPCSTTADCAPLGRNFECQASCGGSTAGLCVDK